MNEKKEPIEVEIDEPWPPPCDKCDDTGLIDADMGGGEGKMVYCDCLWGEWQLERDKHLYDDYIDRKVHEKMGA